MWFGAGDAIGRVDSGGAISSFRLPAGVHADGRMTSAGDGGMWFADRRDQRIGRIDAHGAARSFRTVGTPTGLAPGADGVTRWYATSTFGGGFINRLVIRDLPAGRARGVHCDTHHQPACGRFDAVPSGNTVLLNAFGATGEVTRTDDGQIVVGSGSGSQLGAYAYAGGNVILVVGHQKLVSDLDEGLRRVREYSLPREYLRMQAEGFPGSLLAKTLIIHQEPSARINVILVPETLGF